MCFRVFKRNLKNKRVGIVGFGVSNTAIVKLLIECGAVISIFDKNKNLQTVDFGDVTIKWCLGEDYLAALLANKFDLIFKTPVMRSDTPQLLEAKACGAEIVSEMDIFFKYCPAPIIAVTGSDGKTTTATLIYEMLKKEGYVCYLGGNIGKSLIENLDTISPSDKIVVEVSSFQLQAMRYCNCQVAVITNITPNHLDWHVSMDEYVAAKRNIFTGKYCKHLVLNYDNEITKKIAEEMPNSVLFSSKHLLNNGICLESGAIVERKNACTKEQILNVGDIKLLGAHNTENYMAAIAVVLGQVSLANIGYVAKNFGGVEHRIEFVRNVDGINYYNDSIASTPVRACAGIKSFGYLDRKIILIAGGYDKNLPFDNIGVVVNTFVKSVILIGVAANKIEKSIKCAENYQNDNAVKILHASNMEQAVKLAKDQAERGDVIILSPACASFDMFKNFAERGRAFKEAVNSL